ncbi:PREDICTED: transmembrane protein 53-like [Amphimedon queenslandica]|uniref:DUF829 domain-containing protein n=1 Tax=Amphimedon queenslandica TaxID=400682 RepID=A0A1X7VL87_AMPQE|nr:PREDICTED: transmembrane protein 53-like [Amphimedon queenslandica]|eukprot:XP_011409955.1 PREDICTED: transmembrane protein 53-like [Amphimedon queenslandica]
MATSMATTRNLLSFCYCHSWRGLETGIKALPGAKIYLPSAEVKKSSNSIAVLTGWAMSSHRALGKYSQIYTESGIPSLCLTPSLLELWSSRKGDTLTLKIIDYLTGSKEPEVPVNVVFHLFSGTPGIILPALTNQLSAGGSNVNVKGIIIDSGPVEFIYTSGKRALQLAKLNKIVYYIAGLGGTTFDLLVGRKKRAELVEAMHSPALSSIPQLYLNSESDTVCPPERVKRLVEEQRRMGRDVHHFSWSDSQHVRLYLDHPVEYESRIESFLKTIKLTT